MKISDQAKCRVMFVMMAALFFVFPVVNFFVTKDREWYGILKATGINKSIMYCMARDDLYPDSVFDTHLIKLEEQQKIDDCKYNAKNKLDQNNKGISMSKQIDNNCFS